MTRPTGAYAWLNDEPGPRMLLEALKLYGTLEFPGAPDNPVIVAWADEVAAKHPTDYATWAADWYRDDSIAWCGLAMAVCAVRANVDSRPDRNPPDKYLSALAWMGFGEGIPKGEAELGDVLVFQRAGGGHVGLCVGTSPGYLHVLGGNQNDAVSITRITKNRLVGVRRIPYLNKPANVRKIVLADAGPVSTDEA